MALEVERICTDASIDCMPMTDPVEQNVCEIGSASLKE